MQHPGDGPERLPSIILQWKLPDHMQIPRMLRMPAFVAKKSQHRNYQQQERVALSQAFLKRN
jgi:hypothetical protein